MFIHDVYVYMNVYSHTCSTMPHPAPYCQAPSSFIGEMFTHFPGFEVHDTNPKTPSVHGWLPSYYGVLLNSLIIRLHRSSLESGLTLVLQPTPVVSLKVKITYLLYWPLLYCYIFLCLIICLCVFGCMHVYVFSNVIMQFEKKINFK